MPRPRSSVREYMQQRIGLRHENDPSLCRLPWSRGQSREARRELRNRGIGGGAGNFLNDLHRFDLLLRSWSDLSNQNVAGALPPARMSPGFAACDQGLYLYGGKEETGE